MISISTYHWNDGRGARPGTIALTGADGTELGPWAATGSSGSGVSNANWTVTPGSASKPVVIDGSYTCDDSDPATWAQNTGTRGHGFCKLTVQQWQGPVPYHCVGNQSVLFDNFNHTPVTTGGTAPGFAVTTPTCLFSISTYHYNQGNGAAPGTLGLVSTSGATFGPYPATGNPGPATASHPHGVPDAIWTATPGSGTAPVVIDGGYSCADSDPLTWSTTRSRTGRTSAR